MSRHYGFDDPWEPHTEYFDNCSAMPAGEFDDMWSSFEYDGSGCPSGNYFFEKDPTLKFARPPAHERKPSSRHRVERKEMRCSHQLDVDEIPLRCLSVESEILSLLSSLKGCGADVSKCDPITIRIRFFMNELKALYRYDAQFIAAHVSIM